MQALATGDAGGEQLEVHCATTTTSATTQRSLRVKHTMHSGMHTHHTWGLTPLHLIAACPPHVRAYC